MVAMGESEKRLRELATGRDWAGPILADLRRELSQAREGLIARGADLFAGWDGEASEAARAAASRLVDRFATLEQQCLEIEQVVRNDNLARQHDAEVSLRQLPSGAIPDPMIRALLQGASIISPLGGVITAATQGFFANQLAEERERIASAALRKVEGKIRAAAQDLGHRTTDLVTVNEKFNKGDFGTTNDPRNISSPSRSRPWGGADGGSQNKNESSQTSRGGGSGAVPAAGNNVRLGPGSGNEGSTGLPEQGDLPSRPVYPTMPPAIGGLWAVLVVLAAVSVVSGAVLAFRVVAVSWVVVVRGPALGLGPERRRSGDLRPLPRVRVSV